MPEEHEYENEEPIPEFPEDWAVIGVFQQKFYLNDGTEFNGFAIKSPMTDEVWIHPEITGLSYMDLVQVFADANKTSVIRCDASPNEQTEYIGYTRLTNILAQTDGTYNICMTKPISE